MASIKQAGSKFEWLLEVDIYAKHSLRKIYERICYKHEDY